MRRKLMFRMLFVAIGALACAVATGGAAARGSSTMTVTCHLRLFDQAPPTALEGFDLGFASCSRPLGNGLQADRFKVRLTSPTTAVLTGPFKDFLPDFRRSGAHDGPEKGVIAGLFPLSAGSPRVSTDRG